MFLRCSCYTEEGGPFCWARVSHGEAILRRSCISGSKYVNLYSNVVLQPMIPLSAHGTRCLKIDMPPPITPYAELHCKTNFSFLIGASHPEELVERAIELGYSALAITDRNSLSGVVRAHAAIQAVEASSKEARPPSSSHSARMKLIIGAEIVPVDAPAVLLWAPDLAAYRRLATLITLGRRRAAKGECELSFHDIATHAQGLLAGVLCPPDESSSENLDRYVQYRDVFGDRGYLRASLFRSANDSSRIARWMRLEKNSQLPLVASGDVHYHDRSRMPLFDIVQAIRKGSTVDKIASERFANAERHLRDRREIMRLFSAIPDAVARTGEIADRCSFSLDALRFDYPKECTPDGMSGFAYLEQLTRSGAVARYQHLAGGVPSKVQQLLEHELALIEELHYEDYFLTVWDLVRFARERNILCQGRGSAANSAVCFCLGITAVDPATTDVLFERFISRERNEAPDIDVDFEHERREEVLQYLYRKYGRDRAGMTGVFITYRMRSAIRDVSTALGLSPDRVDALAKQVDGYGDTDRLDERLAQVGIAPESEMGKRLQWSIPQLIGFPRHLSQHVGGMVLTDGPLHERVPIENAAMPGRTVIGWDKNDLDTLGILKVDCLSLGMLSAIRRAFALVAKHEGKNWTLATIPPDDPSVYDMICRADTMGVFQIESRAQMSMLPRLKPRCFYDLVIEVAIVRPGPIQGQMVHPYLRRRNGDEPVTYASDAIRQVLEKTLGIPIFQEQAMRLAVVAAGFTPGQADQLRRAMAAWKRPGIIDAFEEKLVTGMLERGLSEKFARQLFQQIRGFGEYGFPESHAASFALLVYVSAFLKHYHPAAFTTAILNSQPMGFYAPAQLIRDAIDHGVTVLPIDINHSDWDCTLQSDCNREQTRLAKTRVDPSRNGSPAIRLGLRMVNGLRQDHAADIVSARSSGPFTSQADLARRAPCGSGTLRILADSDAFGSLNQNRRQALWDALAEEKQPRSLPLFTKAPRSTDATNTTTGIGRASSSIGNRSQQSRPVPPCDATALPEMDPLSEVFADYETTGLSLRGHPLAFFRDALERHQIITAEALRTVPHNTSVTVGGLVLLRQRPSTAKGITFVTLEDETGTINLVLHVAIWERYYAIARRGTAWIAKGRVETKDSVTHVVVRELFHLANFLDLDGRPIAPQSRDFR